MMDNYAIADQFSLLGKLMDMHGENSFNAKRNGSIAFAIEKLPEQLSTMTEKEMAALPTVGATTAKKVWEILQTGELKDLRERLDKTPPGVVEMLNIKGIGPKKIATIWKEMEIETIGELLYACEENRLTRFKGFGEKTQTGVKESIHFYQRSQGNFLYQQVEELAASCLQFLQAQFGATAVRSTGLFRRQMETMDCLEFVVHDTVERTKDKIASANAALTLSETNANDLVYQHESGCKLKLYTCNDEFRDERMFFTSASDEFLVAFKNQFPNVEYSGSETDSDENIFAQASIQFVPPFLREQASIIDKAKANKIPTVIQPNDIKGIIHSHSKWSDGTNSIEEMVKGCIALGLEYLVISDHSKSAFYAQGLSEEQIVKQHVEVDALNKKYAPFRIFKSIECDILGDGSLDYDDDVLQSFDLLITSIHSNLKMSEEKAMQRLIGAIENPYTTILGHMTGRLLLSRNGYPVDHKKIIEACAANTVVIELNAHPVRLDMDWRWIDYALEKGVLISINPDAHNVEGFADVKYGVLAAQKGGLTKANNLSSFSLRELEDYIMEIRNEKGI
jgi:DNA polymerase (family X)